ncbi:MAG TPA: methyltransferase domain-containing protein [Candidatus Dormibacteraeota bacterium]|nr:methyltransferase domain-containing protein [Candidatus Dormibacteraeota bacterium]
MSEIDWEARWKGILEDRASMAAGHSDPHYWDRRAQSFASATQARADEFLRVLEPYLSPHKTLIDVGAGAGRHSVPLADRLEWVTAVEPSEGMRAQIPSRDNMTVVASTWEDAEVAPADLVICSHVMYGVADPVAFITKMDRSARDRVFILMRETELPHAGAEVRRRLIGDAGPRMPRFSDLFMLLMQMGIAPEVHFLSYPIQHRYPDMEEAVIDASGMFGAGWDDETGRPVLAEVLHKDGDELVFDGGVVLSGVAHWQPQAR